MDAMVELRSLGDGKFRIGSDLTVATVPKLWALSRKLLPPTEASTISIDVSRVTNVDSGGLALLVAWARWANFREKQFKLQGCNEKLAVLIDNNQLERLFYSS